MSGFLRNLFRWYQYRRVVAVLIGLVIGLGMYWLYSTDLLGLHPEDCLFPGSSACQLLSTQKPSPQVVIVGIDDQTIADPNINHFPFTRDKYATLLKQLAADNVAAVAFDIGFTESFSGDQEFRTQLLKMKAANIPVILAYGASGYLAQNGSLKMVGQDELPLRDFRCADASTDPLAPCSEPLTELASTGIIPQPDGVVRSIPMFVQPQCYPARCSTRFVTPLGFAAYRASLQAQSVPLAEGPAGATFGQVWQKPLPVLPDGQALVNFTGPPNNFKDNGQYVSFKDVFEGTVPRSKLDGKIVLIGAYKATGLHDEQQVPTGAGTPMAGVEVHANFLSMLVKYPQPFLFDEPAWAVLITLLGLGILLGLLLAQLSAVRGLVATGAVIVIYTLAMVLAFLTQNMVPNLLHPWLTTALTLGGMTAYRVLYEDREKRRVTALFGQYLSPEIVQNLAAGGHAEVVLQGHRRELSLLFCDIRGFTSTSESMEAEAVAAVVEEYLTDLSDIIGKWRGTIDKYVGDEIMAFWNAPTDQPDHALLAVRCAFEMLAHGPELQAKLQARGLPAIRFGVGVNSGPAVVGNMGSRKAPWFAGRAQYTALGDVVNTGARFCGAAGPFELLLGQETYEAVKDYVAVELKPGLQLKGKSAETFRVYSAMAIRQDPGSPWVPFPAALAQQTAAYTEQTMLAAGSTIAAESAEGSGPPPAPAPTTEG